MNESVVTAEKCCLRRRGVQDPAHSCALPSAMGQAQHGSPGHREVSFLFTQGLKIMQKKEHLQEATAMKSSQILFLKCCKFGEKLWCDLRGLMEQRTQGHTLPAQPPGDMPRAAS